MKLAVCLYKFFPFGGLARDFVRIMQATCQPADQVDVFVMEWQGEIPEHFNVKVIPVTGLSNHARLKSYQQQLQPLLNAGQYDLVIGFNKMPGLDLYYAADPCYIDRIKTHPLYGLLKYTGRVRFFSECERAVFAEASNTVTLMISDVQQQLFEKHYHTPENRLISLPPGIDPDRKRPDDADKVRNELRQELALANENWMLLMVGTAFHTKGVDRAIAGLAALAPELKQQTHLYIVGDGDSQSLLKQAARYGVVEQVHFLGGRKDVPRFLLAADLLVHPARKENTGTVILEAMVAGLPMLVSDVCGYSKHVVASQAGKVLQAADDAGQTASDITQMLDRDRLSLYSAKALDYAATEDLYSMPQKVATIIREQVERKRNVHI